MSQPKGLNRSRLWYTPGETSEGLTESKRSALLIELPFFFQTADTVMGVSTTDDNEIVQLSVRLLPA